MIWTVQNYIGPIEGQGIRALSNLTGLSRGFKIYVSFSCLAQTFVSNDLQNNLVKYLAFEAKYDVVLGFSSGAG